VEDMLEEEKSEENIDLLDIEYTTSHDEGQA